jgi:putative transposase
MSTDYNHGFRSVYKLTAHVVFVIKYRRKVINNEILARLKEIFVSTSQNGTAHYLISTVNRITFT